MAEEITKFRGYCVYINDILKYAQIVGIMNNKDDSNEAIFVSLDEDEELAVVYINEKFYPIVYDKKQLCIKLKEPLNDELLYTTYYNKEVEEVTYNKQKLDYLCINKNIEIYEIPDELKYKLFTYEITKDGLFSFLSYSNPLDLNIFTNKTPNTNISRVSPDNNKFISKVENFSITLIKNINYSINSEIELSVIIDRSGNILSYFDSYKDNNGEIIISFKTAVTLDCSVFISDNAISVKVLNSSKGGEAAPETTEEDFSIPYFLTDYTYEEEGEEPETPEIEETVVVDGVVYHSTQPAQPLGNYVLHTIVRDGVTYYAWILSEPIVELIEYYVTPDANSTSSTTFNGLFKYYNGETAVNTGRRRVQDTVFINKSSINRIDVIPQIRTRAHFVGEEGNRNIIFKGNSIKVIVTEDTIDLNGIHTLMCYDIIYNKAYTISLGTIRYLKLKIEFYVDDIYHLEKIVLFYNTSTNLYNKLITSNVFNQSVYNSLIDILTGEPAVVKYGCLLLTGHDVIESVKTNELDENDLPITKLLAELVPTTKVRMGNLKGIYNETFRTNLPHGYGLYGESVYLTGNFYLNNGKSLVDISNDVTMAVGNINRILNTLANLDSNFLNSIYNLTVSLSMMASTLAASFSSIISNNNDAIFKLGKDYSIWSLGNAGVAIINPNATYTESGDIDDSTVGDNDEYVLLQGESVQISTSVIKNNRLKVIVCNVDPLGFTYPQSSGSEQLYYPDNSGIKFAIGWIATGENNPYITGEKHIIYPEDSSVAKDYYRYVALEKTVSIDNSDELAQVPSPTRDNCNIYSFTTSRIVSGADIYKTFNGSTTFDSANSYYVIPDILVAGLFEDGKFNANLINVQDLVAVELQYKDLGFDVTSPIKWHPSYDDHNYPTTNVDKPFAVISGETGKITALGVDLKEAIIGEPTSTHIHITDNAGTATEGSRNEPNDAGEPGIYIKNDDILNTRITGKVLDLDADIYGKKDKTIGTRSKNLAFTEGETLALKQIRYYNRNTKDFTEAQATASGDVNNIVGQTITHTLESSTNYSSTYDLLGSLKKVTKKITGNNILYVNYITIKINLLNYSSNLKYYVRDVPNFMSTKEFDINSGNTVEFADFNCYTQCLVISNFPGSNFQAQVWAYDSNNHTVMFNTKVEYAWNASDKTLKILRIFGPSISKVEVVITNRTNSVPRVIVPSGTLDGIYNYDIDLVSYTFEDTSISKTKVVRIKDLKVKIPKKSSATFTLAGYTLSNVNNYIKSFNIENTGGVMGTIFKTPMSCYIEVGIGLADENNNLIYKLNKKTYAVHGIQQERSDTNKYELDQFTVIASTTNMINPPSLYLTNATKLVYAENVKHAIGHLEVLNEFVDLNLDGQSIYYNNSSSELETYLVFFILIGFLQNILKVTDFLTYFDKNSLLPDGYYTYIPLDVNLHLLGGGGNDGGDGDIHLPHSWTVDDLNSCVYPETIYNRCFKQSNVWNVDKFPYKINFYSTASISSGNVLIHYNSFNTNIIGNGFGSGFNNKNLISINVLGQNTNSPCINANIVSNGNGIKLNNGFSEVLCGLSGRHYFTILNGFISLYDILGNNLGYNYSGYSIINTNNSDNVDCGNISGLSVTPLNLLFLSYYTILMLFYIAALLVGNIVSSIFDSNVDYPEIPFNTSLENIKYSNLYDLYWGTLHYRWTDGHGHDGEVSEDGDILIIFGKKWEAIFNKTTNISEDNFKVKIIANYASISPTYSFLKFGKTINTRTVVGNNIVTQNVYLQDNKTTTNNKKISMKYGLQISLRDIFKENTLQLNLSQLTPPVLVADVNNIFNNSATTTSSPFKLIVEYAPE